MIKSDELKNQEIIQCATLCGLFLFGRLMLLLSLPLEGLRGYGDALNYIQLARLGLPFIDYWVEFPPVFPFLNAAFAWLSAGREQVFLYLFFILMSLCQAGSLYLFIRLAQMASPWRYRQALSLVYFAILLTLPYGWWYFDPLVVFSMLLAIYWLTKGKDGRAAFLVALGILTKLFPALLLPAIWRSRTPRRAIWITLLCLGCVAIIYGVLYLRSPQMTVASLASQSSKGSWETPWALIDGNFRTGNFGGYNQRYDPSKAYELLGNPARLPGWLTLIFFGGLGAWVWWKARLETPVDLIAFLGFTWCLFLLWSPGWSPQWCLYLLPLFLLVLSYKDAILVTTAFILVNLLEWPLLLSRGLTSGLWLSIPLRTILLVMAAYLFWSRFNTFKPSLELEQKLV